MCVCRTAEGVCVVSDSEFLFMSVLLDDDDPAGNAAERHKIIKFSGRGWGGGKGNIRRN